MFREERRWKVVGFRIQECRMVCSGDHVDRLDGGGYEQKTIAVRC